MSIDLKPRKKPRQGRSRETVAVILEAATQVFEERGYQETSTNQIAERAGVSIGSLYQYFPNKESILYMLLERHVESINRLIESQIVEIEKAGGFGKTAIRSIIQLFIGLHENEPAYHRIIMEEVPYEHQKLIQIVREGERNAVEQWKRVMERTPGIRLRDKNMAANMFVQTVNALTHRYVILKDADFNLDAFVDNITDMLLRYLFHYSDEPESNEDGDVENDIGKKNQLLKDLGFRTP